MSSEQNSTWHGKRYPKLQVKGLSSLWVLEMQCTTHVVMLEKASRWRGCPLYDFLKCRHYPCCNLWKASLISVYFMYNSAACTSRSGWLRLHMLNILLFLLSIFPTTYFYFQHGRTCSISMVQCSVSMCCVNCHFLPLVFFTSLFLFCIYCFLIAKTVTYGVLKVML